MGLVQSECSSFPSSTESYKVGSATDSARARGCADFPASHFSLFFVAGRHICCNSSVEDAILRKT